MRTRNESVRGSTVCNRQRTKAKVITVAAYTAISLLSLAAPPQEVAASILWTTPELAVEVADTVSVVINDLLLSRSDPDMLHLSSRHIFPRYVWGVTNTQGFYNFRDGNGWSGAEPFTDGTNPPETTHPFSTDFQTVVDADDQLHTVFEAHWYRWPAYQDTMNFGDHYIGYLDQDALWGPESTPFDVSDLSTDSTLAQQAASPSLALANGQLHVTWYGAGGVKYRTKSVSDGVDDWGDVVHVTNGGGAVSFAAEDDGTVHILAVSSANNGGGNRTTTVRHRWGTPPATGNWTIENEVILDTFSWVVCDTLNDGPPTDGGDAAILMGPAQGPGGAPLLYFVWEHRMPDCERALAFAVDSAGTWIPGLPTVGQPWPSTRLLSDPGDGWHTRAEQLVANEFGLHLFWHEVQTGDFFLNSKEIYHCFTPNPLDTLAWGGIGSVVPGDSVGLFRPRAAVRDTVVYVAYSRDDPNKDPSIPPNQERFEAFFREGHVLPDSTTASVTWSSYVFLDRDFVVAAGDTLTIEDGTLVECSGEDKRNLGADTTHVELIVRPGGCLLAEGTANSTITFRSASPGSTWYGIRLGSAAGTTPSSLHYVDFEDAVCAVTVDSLSGDLVHCTFDSSAAADIYLPQDTRVPSGYEWVLDAPTRVVADTVSARDDVLGTDDLCDLIVLGTLAAQRPGSAGPSDYVVFESVARDSVLADDWGGITIGAGGQASLHDCDIAFGLRGVYFAAANSPEIVDSHIHHYSEEGIYDYGSNALIEGCLVERGENLHPDTTTTAIRTHSSVASILDNQIEWQTDFGIWVGFNSFLCAYQPWGEDAEVQIVGNRITGDGGDDERDGSAGIRAEYVCHDYSAVIEADTVTTWQGRALDLYEIADVVVQCNVFEDNYVAARYYRTGALLPYEESVLWFQNSLKESQYRNLIVSGDLRGLDACVLYDSASAGQNSLKRDYAVEDARNIRLDPKTVSTYTLDASHQAWIDSLDAAIDEPDTAAATNDPVLPGEILVTPLEEGETECSGGGASRSAGRKETVVQAGHEVKGASAAAQIPDRWSVSLAGANPTTGGVRLVIGVPTAGSVRVTAYDVGGRRVGVLHDGWLSPGYHEVRSEGLAHGGERVSAGVYFLRTEGPGFRDTRKVVILSTGG